MLKWMIWGTDLDIFLVRTPGLFSRDPPILIVNLVEQGRRLVLNLRKAEVQFQVKSKQKSTILPSPLGWTSSAKAQNPPPSLLC